LQASLVLLAIVMFVLSVAQAPMIGQVRRGSLSGTVYDPAGAVIPNAALREKFVAGRVDLVQTVNVFGYTAAFAAYRDGQPWLDELLRYLEANRDFVVEYVKTRLPGVKMAPPEATYLGWLDCRAAGPAARDPFTFFLDKAKVALNDGALFGPGGEGFVRLNFGCPRSVLTEALDRMRAALTDGRPARV